MVGGVDILSSVGTFGNSSSSFLSVVETKIVGEGGVN